MWRIKQFMPKEQTGLEGRTIDIGNLKVHVRNAIAEGGFSCVYLARDAIHGSKQYALKHIICNDEESLEVVKKEISVMKSLRGHPNVVPLYSHDIFDMGRTKEALLVMEYCEKSLVTVLESRGAGYFEEKQILVIFRDVCNAVFAMHCQSPPIAHRDLKAENVLLGSDGLWKLCDFGSTSTNHKRFERPEDMGIEEDNIRKHTTPAYRAPEMWDLFLRELINEKVDIWALGCLLFRICYFKSAFDGESKLQILNGNYRIPELPKYSSSITDLIRDMLQSSPDARPDITQVWFRVNDLLPDELQNSLPARPPEVQQPGIPKPANITHPMPRRSPPPPPSAEPTRNASPPPVNNTKAGGGALGAFWSSQHAKDSLVVEDKVGPKFDEEPSTRSSTKNERIQPERQAFSPNTRPSEEENINPCPVPKNMHGKSVNRSGDGPSKELKFFQDDSGRNAGRSKASHPESAPAFPNESFNTFVAEFDTSKLSSGITGKKSGKEEELEAEVERLKEQLKQANVEKAEINSKYEKLSAICRSQRQEIQELKQTLAARTQTPNKEAPKDQTSPGIQPPVATPQREKIEGPVQELQQGLFDDNSPSPEPNSWQAFPDVPKPQTTSVNNAPKSVRTRNGHQNKPATQGLSGSDAWGFGTEGFTAVPTATSRVSRSGNELNNSQRFGEPKNMENKPASQPAGWAGF
ncbi:Serine/threonine-protein kinase [Actinidia chinensis var. chinensis]|uniref:non-specific serine/threonine protein kinase n=1 Tax=Actinidia chinensis var. chinensis TaxID=1590841 RepID=A0A2R6QPW2_ACTCC|nr:Serine/threonine-protein kinase [Actinidia chinensis var. chinensis]